ncbi:hypothetical protein KCU88_g53, partial [Aureobasidium melanogenum]
LSTIPPSYRQLIMSAVAMSNDTRAKNTSNSHLGLDGTLEDSPSAPSPGPGYRTEPTCYARPTTAPGGMSDIEPRHPEPWSVVEGDDFENETTPRKRRRLSSGLQEPQVQPCSNKQTVLMRTWQQQLEEAATGLGDGTSKEAQEKSGKLGEQLSSIDTHPDSKPGQAACTPNVSDKKRECNNVTPEGLSSTNVHTVPSATDPPTTDPLTEVDKETSTTKQKTMQIGSNGKLTTLSQSLARHSPRTKQKAQSDQGDGGRKVSQSSRKVQIKNGRFISSLRVALPYRSTDCGRKIEQILSQQPTTSGTAAQGPAVPSVDSVAKGVKTTHPFFLGNLAPKASKQSHVKNEAPAGRPARNNDTNENAGEAPKPWDEIKFSTNRPLFQSKVLEGISPIWPPVSLQLVEPSNDRLTSRTILPDLGSARKLKHQVSGVNPAEDVLWIFARDLQRGRQGLTSLHLPTRKVMSGKALNAELDAELGTGSRQPPHLSSLKSRIELDLSPFDKGIAAGPQMWPQEYAPTCWPDVLQPQVQILHDWLSTLKVHQIQSGKLVPKAKAQIMKKRRKRRSDELDDFIVNSDEENEEPSGKNAILIAGPPGCGKTAAVFAVAQQLGFEVFEIHAGMRRSARDIQEKVGDMTQNHLVQQASSLSNLSRASSMSLDDSTVVPPCSGPLPANQPTMGSFITLGKGRANNKPSEEPSSKEAKVKAQKQSLILFEEVDILFDEDKGFWAGVQSLIRTSKRPVIMTCNNIASVPLDDLDLFTVLNFERPDMGLSVERLAFAAAAEGHLLKRQALQDLYLSKGRDLRASLTELNLWCQMTVGSQQGGLDWMLPYEYGRQGSQEGSVTRIVSQDTFISGLDLYPAELYDPEDMIKYSEESLGLLPLDWVKDHQVVQQEGRHLQLLDDMLALSDARSVIDVVDTDVACLMAGMMMTNKTFASGHPVTNPRQEIVRLYLEQQESIGSNNGLLVNRADIANALGPLMEETRIGLPTSPGRKAPSLDNMALSLVTEVAPYVRTIVEHDLRLEQMRSELEGVGGGSQTTGSRRPRKTRAARAALEGGTKTSTRRDRWFPESLDFAAVLASAGDGWPKVLVGPEKDASQAGLVEVEMSSAAATPASSMAMEGE